MAVNVSNYIHGAVQIKVTGAMPEKLINLCIAQDMFLWRITKEQEALYAWMKLEDFFAIRPLVHKSNTHVRVIKHYGLPFAYKRLKRRKLLLAGPVVFIFALYMMASYLWFVDVTGTKTISAEQVKKAAYQSGLHPGILKDTVNSKKIENEILVAIPEIAWVGIHVTGTRAVIEVVEKTVQKQEDKSPANIIAIKDGIVSEIIVLAGQSSLKKGDTVKKGDILIKGLIPVPINADGQPLPSLTPQLVKARGIIKARTWYESYGEAELKKEYHNRTGRQEIAVVVKFGSTDIVLKSARPELFPQYETEVIHKKLPQWRNSDFTVESTINIYRELDTNWSEISMEEARDAAKTKALAAVQQLLPESAQIVSRSIELIKTAESNLVRVKVGIEAEEDIGQDILIVQ